MKNIFFDMIEREKASYYLGTDQPVEFNFPTFFYRTECIQMAFIFPLNELRTMMTYKSLEPVTLIPGLGVMALTIYNHLEISEMKPYREAVFSIFVKPVKRWLPPVLPLIAESTFPQVRHLVVDMPVDSEINRLRGNVIWALPKTKGEIDWKTNHNQHELNISTEALEIDIQVPTGGAIHRLNRVNSIVGNLRDEPTIAYSASDGYFSRQKHLFKRPRNWAANLKLRDASHPFAHLASEWPAPMEIRHCQELKMALYLPSVGHVI